MRILKSSTALLLALLCLMLCCATAFAQELTLDEQIAAAQQQYGGYYVRLEDTVYATGGNAHIRKGPGMDQDKVGLLTDGQAITRVAIGSGEWSMVLYNDQLAFIHNSMLTLAVPGESGTTPDVTDLQLQVAIAGGMDKSAYTTESWQLLTDLLTLADQAAKGASQSVVDGVTQALQAVILDMDTTDHTALQQALADVEQLTIDGQLTSRWFHLTDAVARGKALLGSGDQAAMDQAADEIAMLLEQVKAELAELENPEVVIQGVPVEVPPTGPYCNVATHRLWFILCLVSMVLNIAMVTGVFIYIYRRKKIRQDDTPLVDYDIYDDAL